MEEYEGVIIFMTLKLDQSMETLLGLRGTVSTEHNMDLGER